MISTIERSSSIRKASAATTKTTPYAAATITMTPIRPGRSAEPPATRVRRAARADRVVDEQADHARDRGREGGPDAKPGRRPRTRGRPTRRRSRTGSTPASSQAAMAMARAMPGRPSGSTSSDREDRVDDDRQDRRPGPASGCPGARRTPGPGRRSGHGRRGRPRNARRVAAVSSIGGRVEAPEQQRDDSRRQDRGQ